MKFEKSIVANLFKVEITRMCKSAQYNKHFNNNKTFYNITRISRNVTNLIIVRALLFIVEKIFRLVKLISICESKSINIVSN